MRWTRVKINRWYVKLALLPKKMDLYCSILWLNQMLRLFVVILEYMELAKIGFKMLLALKMFNYKLKLSVTMRLSSVMESSTI